MPVLSYVHQLFNTDQCHAYIHTLRWKDRPLQCPRCQMPQRWSVGRLRSCTSSMRVNTRGLPGDCL
jgi:transposase-like zinc ribbon protein